MIIWMSHKPHARWATLPMLATCACLSQVVRCTRCRIPGERRRAEPSARTARSSYEMLQLFTFLLQLHQNSGKLCNFGEIPWPRFGYFKNKGVTGWSWQPLPKQMEVQESMRIFLCGFQGPAFLGFSWDSVGGMKASPSQLSPAVLGGCSGSPQAWQHRRLCELN